MVEIFKKALSSLCVIHQVYLGACINPCTSRKIPGKKKQKFHCAGPDVIKLFSYSTQLSTKFILLINVKMPTIVGILTFISMVNTTTERLKARHFFICRYFSIYELSKFHAQSCLA